jgi:hypothetical protein
VTLRLTSSTDSVTAVRLFEKITHDLVPEQPRIGVAHDGVGRVDVGDERTVIVVDAAATP